MTGWGCNVRQQRLGKRLYPNQARGRLTAAEGRSIAPQRTAREKTLVKALRFFKRSWYGDNPLRTYSSVG